MAFNHRNFRAGLACALALMIVVATPALTNPFVATSAPLVPVVRACSNCNWILSWGSYGTGQGQFGGILRGLALDSSGNVYVPDFQDGNDRIEKFTSTGSFLLAWGCDNAATQGCPPSNADGQFNGPLAVAVDSAAGAIYVTDSGNYRVQKFDLSGNFLLTWGTASDSNNQGADHFSSETTGIAVDSGGNVYVVDNGLDRVDEFTSGGALITAFGCAKAATNWCTPGGDGNGQFNRPFGVAVDSGGNVYVTDGNNNRVEKFDSNLAYVTQWGTFGHGNGQFDNPVGVALDSGGAVYVSDDSNDRVQKFDGSGTWLMSFGGFGCGDGQFGCGGGSGPWGIAVDSGGNVYVTDSTNARVEVFGDVTNTLTTSVAGSGSVSVTDNNSPASCVNGVCTIGDGDAVVVTANPATNWKFSAWSGTSSCTNTPSTNPCPSFSMPSSDVTVTATFTQLAQSQTLTTNVASGSGSVSPNCPSGCSELVVSSISVTATPSSANWQFSSWTISGASCSGGSKSSPCTFTMPNNAVTVSATFTQVRLNTGALTTGFWKNSNGQKIISGQTSSGVCPSTTYLLQFAPFTDLSPTATCPQVASYVYSVINGATCTSTSSTCNSMLKAQMLATALDVYFSGSGSTSCGITATTVACGGDKIKPYNGGITTWLGGVTIDLTKICSMTDTSSGSTCSGVYQDASSVFGGSHSLTVLQLLKYESTVATQTSGNTIPNVNTGTSAGLKSWYNQYKLSQVLGKNVFDSINNQVAFGP